MIKEREYGTGVEAEATKQPALDRLSASVEQIHKAVSYSAEMSSRLCGSLPEGKDEGSEGYPVSGVFDGIERYARQLEELAADLTRSTQRIMDRL